MTKQLTPKQRRFVEEYPVDFNATAAAVRSGYSEKTARAIGAENLTKPHIAEAIQKTMAEISEKAEITVEQIVEELRLVAFSDMRNYVKWGSRGIRLKASEGLDEDVARVVAEVSQTETVSGGSIKFKLHDKLSALKMLGQYKQMFVERKEITGKDDGPIQHEVRGNFDLAAEVQKIRGAIAEEEGDSEAQGQV